LVIVGVVLTLSFTYIGLTYAIPRIQEPNIQSPVTALGFYAVLNMLSRYGLAVLTNPGDEFSACYKRVLKARSSMLMVDGGEQQQQFDRNNTNTRSEEDGNVIITNPDLPPSLLSWSKCQKSGLMKPPRAHYDRVSTRLVMNFDHFCVWIAGPVGYNNYRHFFWFLFWTWISTTIGALVSMEPCLATLNDESYPKSIRMCFLSMFATCQLLSLAIGSMFAHHVYLAATAQTAIDQLVLNGRRHRFPRLANPYDSGSMIENLRNSVTSYGGGFYEIFIPPWHLRNTFPHGPPWPGAWG
jgi:hypothetical protein